MGKCIKMFLPICCIILVGCSIINVKSKINNEDYISEIGNEILMCIKDKDKEALNNLFCDKVKDSEYLREQINYVFDYIDKSGGLIIEDGKWKIPYSHNTYDGSGNSSLEYFSIDYTGKIFINNKQYNFGFTMYKVFKYHRDYEGVINVDFQEHKTSEMIDKSLEYREINKIEKRIFLGFNFYNIDNVTFQSVSILPKELNENEEYELLDSIEKDR